MDLIIPAILFSCPRLPEQGILKSQNLCFVSSAPEARGIGLESITLYKLYPIQTTEVRVYAEENLQLLQSQRLESCSGSVVCHCPKLCF